MVLHDDPGAIGRHQNLCHNGPHKGATLAEVAMHDPDYVRGLVNRAQRPEVREAAGRLVSALEAAAEHKPRAARGANRKSSAKRSGPRG